MARIGHFFVRGATITIPTVRPSNPSLTGYAGTGTLALVSLAGIAKSNKADSSIPGVTWRHRVRLSNWPIPSRSQSAARAYTGRTNWLHCWTGPAALRLKRRCESTSWRRRLAGPLGGLLGRPVLYPPALNFASARNPGGGYVRGARAQEEDLARCSTLYQTQLTQRGYYDANRETKSLLYTDHIIYSPSVPFFRDEQYELLDESVPVSVITAPAPNAGEVLRQGQAGEREIEQTLRRRAGMVLAVAEDQEVRHLVLGAWGCGVFRNDPYMVADAFGVWLESPRFAKSFESIVFAIYVRGGESRTLEAFRERFG